MSSQIDTASLRGTLLATPVSTISNFCKFVQSWVSPGDPQGPQTDPRWVPKMIKRCQKLILQTLSEKAPRHRVLKDTFTQEFTQNLQGPTARKHCYLLHGSHIRISMVLVRFCKLLLSKRMTLRPLLNFFCIHVAPKRHRNAHQAQR